jgi:glucose 1-dehydrogenase
METKISNEPQKALEGQTALVTGASSGIGEGIAKAFAMVGANVVVNFPSFDEVPGKRVLHEIKEAGGNAIGFIADVSKEEQVSSMFKTCCKEFGTVDILVNNAGVQWDSKFVDMTLEQWRFVLDVNLTGGFLCAREAATEFIRRGIVPERSVAAGKMIFISSVHEVIPWANHVNYAASKGGIMMLMKSISQELAPYKVRVNSIAPGAIKTPINKKAWETKEEEAKLLRLIPYQRVGETSDIASAALWLASDQSDYVNGTTLFVDGGMLLYPGFATGG